MSLERRSWKRKTASVVSLFRRDFNQECHAELVSASHKIDPEIEDSTKSNKFRVMRITYVIIPSSVGKSHYSLSILNYFLNRLPFHSYPLQRESVAT